MKTTLNKIRGYSPCGIQPHPNGNLYGFARLMNTLGKTKTDDELITIIQIIDSNGICDAIWCLRAVEGYDKEIRLFMAWCARQVQHLMRDQRSITALDVSERYAKGLATQEELEIAIDDADAASAAADAYASAAADAYAAAAADAYAAAAYAAADAADVAAYAAADAATAYDAATTATAAATYAAAADAYAAAVNEVATTMGAKQEKELRRICNEILSKENHAPI